MIKIPLFLKVSIGKRKYRKLIEDLQNEFERNSLPLDVEKKKLILSQIKKINDLLTLLKKTTPYYQKINLPDYISNFSEYENLIPITKKEMIQENLFDFVRIDRKLDRNTVKTYTTGSTGKPLIIYRTIYDYMYSTSMIRILKNNKMTSNSEIRFVIPKISSIWNTQTLLKIIFPKFKIWTPEYLENLLTNPTTKNKMILEKIEMIFSWTRIPPSIFKRHEDQVTILKPILLMIGGEQMTEEILTYCKRVLPQSVIHDQYATIEFGWVTIMCKNNQMHILEDSFYPEIINKDENGIGELVCTFLYPLTINLLRYATGDLVKEVTCNCGYTGRAIKIIGRVKHEELDKHFTKGNLQLIIDNSPTIIKNFKAEKFVIKKEQLVEKVIFTVILPYLREPSQEIKERAINEFQDNLSKLRTKMLYNIYWEFKLDFIHENNSLYKNEFIDGKIKVIE